MTEALSLKPGDTFAEGFRVVQELGKSGDASALFAAEQTLTGRPCMLRVLHPKFVADKEGRERFDEACKVRASIESEHVVEVIGAGIDRERGTPWFALERLEGEALTAWLSRGALPTDDQAIALDIVGQLGAAFTAVRIAGHAPGNLNPAKIFVTTRQHHDGGITVKLLDFWTGDVTHEAEDPEAPEDLATLAWQAPEIDGEDPTGNLVSDVWSLGLLAFHLLAGKHYWKALAGAKPSAVSLVREISSETHERASVRAKILGFRRALPAGFDDWFARCVAHDPNDRFADPAEAAEALAAILDGDEDEGEEEDLPPPPPRKGGGRRPAEAVVTRARPGGIPQDLMVPVGLGIALVIAIGVFQFVKHQRAAHPTHTPGSPGAPVAAPVNTAPVPRELSASVRSSLVAALQASTGSPVWIAAQASDPQARRFAEDLAQMFTEAGWHVNPISLLEWPGEVFQPGVRIFAADEVEPGYVDTAIRAMAAAGLQANPPMSGYRAFYNSRVLTQPGYHGVNMAADQTFVVLVGPIP